MSDISALFAAAQTEHQAGRLQLAEHLYRQLLADHPDHPPALAWLGVLAYQVGQGAAGLELLDRAITLDDTDVDLHVNRAKVLHGLGDTAAAAQGYDAAIDRRPDLAEAHAALACLEAGTGTDALPAHCRMARIGPHLLLLPPGSPLPEHLAERPRFGRALAELTARLTCRRPGFRAWDRIGGDGEIAALLRSATPTDLTVTAAGDDAQRIIRAYNLRRMGVAAARDDMPPLPADAGLVVAQGDPGQNPDGAPLAALRPVWWLRQPGQAVGTDALASLARWGYRHFLLFDPWGQLLLVPTADEPDLLGRLAPWLAQHAAGGGPAGWLDLCALPDWALPELGDLPTAWREGKAAALADATPPVLDSRIPDVQLRPQRHARPEPLPDLASLRRILVIRLDRLGDFVLTTPLLRHLRRACPNAHITLAVRRYARMLAEQCPHVDQLLVLPDAALENTGVMQRTAERIRRDKDPFDLILVPRWDIDYYQSGILASALQAPWRIAFSEHCRPIKAQLSPGIDGLYSVTVDDRRLVHEAQRGLDLLALMGVPDDQGGLELWWDDADRQAAAQVLAAHGLQPGGYIAFGIGASDGRRRWPVEGWIALGRWLATVTGCRVVPVGGVDCVGDGGMIAAALGPLAADLTAQLSARQTVAAIAGARMLVGCDSFPMHAAAATGRPTVMISCHPADGDPVYDQSPARFGPWRVPHRIIRPATGLEPCTDFCMAVDAAHCITSVTVEMAMAAVTELLAL